MTEEVVIKPIPLICKNGRVRNYKRKFHIKCLEEYLAKRADRKLKKDENDEWGMVYEYYKNKIMRYPETSNLSTYEVRRLNGLRLGQYMPNGNTRAVKKGYSYTTILWTMKFKRMEIVSYLDNHSFNDGEHRINYVMSVLSKNLDFVAERLEKAAEFKSMSEENQEFISKYKDMIDSYATTNDIMTTFKQIINGEGREMLIDALELVSQDNYVMLSLKKIDGATHKLNYVRKVINDDKLPEIKRKNEERARQENAVKRLEKESVANNRKSYQRKGGKRHLSWVD